MTIDFAIMGLGWRSRQFARIARALPDRFRCVGALRRRADGSEEGLPVFSTIDQLLQARPQFVLLSLPWSETPIAIRAFAERGLPILAETPPAPDVPGLLSLYADAATARIQVAEQYPSIPLHAALSRVVADGLLGAITQVDVSVAHGYHGIALIRRLLGVGRERATITGMRHVSSIIDGPGRNGPPETERLVESARSIAGLDFGQGCLGVYDFDDQQYFSWIRAARILVRGTRGEADDRSIRWLADHRTPLQSGIERRDAGIRGNLEGQHHQGYLAAGQWLYRNAFAPARLSDDEIAMATVLTRMGEYVQGGAGPYSLADACHDHYLGILADRSTKTGKPIVSENMPWSDPQFG